MLVVAMTAHRSRPTYNMHIRVDTMGGEAYPVGEISNRA
jgi:hypothetical protein